MDCCLWARKIYVISDATFARSGIPEKSLFLGENSKFCALRLSGFRERIAEYGHIWPYNSAPKPCCLRELMTG